MLCTYASNTVAVNHNLCDLVSSTDNTDCMISDEELACRIGTDCRVARALRGLISKAGLTSMSTAYSGIDSPGTSVLNLLACAESQLGMSTTAPQHLFAVEWDTSCQRELQIHPSGAECLFSNIEDFLREPLKGMLHELVSNDKLRTVLQPVVMQNPSNAVALHLACIKEFP